jgi:hypothetical protein
MILRFCACVRACVCVFILMMMMIMIGRRFSVHQHILRYLLIILFTYFMPLQLPKNFSPFYNLCLFFSVICIHLITSNHHNWLNALVLNKLSLFLVYMSHTQKNGAVSKIDNKFISQPTWAQHALSAAVTVQVAHMLPAVRFSCLVQGCRSSFKDGVSAGGFLCAPFWGVQVHHTRIIYFFKPCMKLTLHCTHRSGHLKTENTESLLLMRHHLGNWSRSKHEKWTAGSAWETWTVPSANSVVVLMLDEK